MARAGRRQKEREKRHNRQDTPGLATALMEGSEPAVTGSGGGFKAILLIPAHTFSPSANFLWRGR